MTTNKTYAQETWDIIRGKKKELYDKNKFAIAGEMHIKDKCHYLAVKHSIQDAGINLGYNGLNEETGIGDVFYIVDWNIRIFNLIINTINKNNQIINNIQLIKQRLPEIYEELKTHI